MMGAGLAFNNEQDIGDYWGYKQTGNSIADISDDDLPMGFLPKDEPTFTSQDALMGPSGNYFGQVISQQEEHQEQASKSTDHFKNGVIPGAPAPVFTPVQREHRVNGMSLNSSRLGSAASRFGSYGSPFSPSIVSKKRPSRFEFSRIDSKDDVEGYEMQPLSRQKKATPSSESTPTCLSYQQQQI